VAINAFHFINQQWHRLSGSRVLFVVIMIIKLCGLSTLEMSYGFNSSYTRPTLNNHDNFAVAFLKSNITVGHVPQEIS